MTDILANPLQSFGKHRKFACRLEGVGISRYK